MQFQENDVIKVTSHYNGEIYYCKIYEVRGQVAIVSIGYTPSDAAKKEDLFIRHISTFDTAEIIERDGKPYVKERWKPCDGQHYYVACTCPKTLSEENTWSNDDMDKLWWSRGLVFQTRDEAIASAKRMLEAIKE